MRKVINRKVTALRDSELTIPEAAKRLGWSEKTVRRYIKDGALPAQKRLIVGKWTYVLEEAVVSRFWTPASIALRETDYFMADDDHNYTGALATRFVFRKWGATEHDTRLPAFTLKVSFADYWRFAFQRPSKAEEHETLRTEIASRIPGSPPEFDVCFELDPAEVHESLMRIVKRVRKPTARAAPRIYLDDLPGEAVTHLQTQVLPKLRMVRTAPESYLAKSVKNFYRDKARGARRYKDHINKFLEGSPEPTGSDVRADVEDLDTLADPTDDREG